MRGTITCKSEDRLAEVERIFVLMQDNYFVEMVDEKNIDEIFEVFVDYYGESEPISACLLRRGLANLQDTKNFFSLVKPYLTSGISQVVRDRSNENQIVTIRFGCDAYDLIEVSEKFNDDKPDSKMYENVEAGFRPNPTQRFVLLFNLNCKLIREFLSF